jgi:ABC-type nitrate/sulfonate/bicarbonate transport system substrate-binding protein
MKRLLSFVDVTSGGARLAGAVLLTLALAACGGGGAAGPAASTASNRAGTAPGGAASASTGSTGAEASGAAAKPAASAAAAGAGASSAPKPAAGASAKPAASGAAAKPAASGAATSAAPPSTAKPAASGLIPIKSAYSQASVTQGAMYTGADLGIFAKYGLDVKPGQVNGPQQMPALLANEIQFAGVGANEIANAALGGAPVEIIATAVDVPFFSLYANSKYKTVEDLAGQNVGITAAGTSTDAAARIFLQKYNMLDKVKILPSGGTQAAVLAAMTQGGIAAGILTSPTSEQAAKAGFVELVNGPSLGVPMNTNSLAAAKPYIQSNKQVVLNFLRGYQAAWQFNADPANEAAVVKVLAKYTQTDEDTIRPAYMQMLKIWGAQKSPTMNPDALGNLLKLSDDPKVKNANPNDFIDNSLLQSIQ